MGTVVSAVVYTVKDNMGNPFTQGWFTVEFRDTGYTPGGEVFDYSAYIRRIEMLVANPISGSDNGMLVRPNATDFPMDAASARLVLDRMASSIVALNISGIGIRIASGTLLTTSGIAGVQSGFAVIGTLFSGLIVATASGDVAVGSLRAELLSGVAVSGIRAITYVMGY